MAHIVRVIVSTAALLATLLPSAAAAQAGGVPVVFVVRTGEDTVATERFTRDGPELRGELVERLGNTRQSYTARLGPGARVDRFEIEVRLGSTPRNAPPVQQARIELRGDSASVEVRRSGASDLRTVPTRAGAIPFVNLSFALMEQVLLRARALGGDQASVPLLVLAGARTIPARVSWIGADSAVIVVAGVEMRAGVGPDGLIRGGSVPSQNLVIERGVVAAEAPAREPPAVDYGAPPDAPYLAEDVAVTVPAGHSLAGTLTRPKDGSRPVPAAVLITGSGPQERDESVVAGYRPFRELADALSRRGIAVLRLDDRGVGGSTGDHASATSADFADDVRAALAFLRRRPEIDNAKLALIGHSEGGLIAPMVAAGDSLLRAIVLMAAPSRTGREILAYQQRYAVERNPGLTAGARDSALESAARQLVSAAARQPWLRFFIDYDPLPVARAVKAPVLILQGGTDRQVTPDQARELAAAIREGGNEDVSLHVFADVNHLFLPDPDGSPAGYAALPSKALAAEVLRVVVEWTVARLGPER